MRPKALAHAFMRSVRQDGIRGAVLKVRRYLGQRALITAAPGAHYLDTAWTAMAKSQVFLPNQPANRIFPRPKVALIGDLNLPQCRKYRVEQVVDLFGQLDVDVNVSHYQDIPRSISLLQDATHLFEYRLPLGETCNMYRYEARRLGLPILYDIDDPLFSYPAYATYSNMKGVSPDLYKRFLAETSRYLAMMNGADILCVSTPGLRDHLARLSARPVYVRRNFADQATLKAGQEVIDRASRTLTDPFTICFASGSLGHEYDFAIAADQTFAFLRKYPDAMLRILGHFPKSAIPEDLQDRAVFNSFSDYNGYLANIATSDCMLMPLAPELFNQCKSAVRAIDAASVAVPALASDVGDNSCLVKTGETGFLIQDNNEWLPALESLYHDRAQARKLGQAARLTLERDWGASDAPNIIAPELVAWLRNQAV